MTFSQQHRGGLLETAFFVGHRVIQRTLLLLAMPLLLTGCQLTGEQLVSPTTERPRAEEMPNMEVTASLFEQRRDQAMMEAAMTRWREGDAATCGNMLQRLIERSPQHRPARMLLADLYVSQNRMAEAEAQLRWLVQSDSRDAQAHHSLGLLLESMNRGGEAVAHFQQAAQLAPENRLYSLSYDALLAGMTPRPPMNAPAPIVPAQQVRHSAPPAAQPNPPTMMAQQADLNLLQGGMWPPPVGAQ